MAQTLKGTVVSTVNDKTIVVKVDRIKRHPLYRKNYKVGKKFYAHDEKNQVNVGDVVEISETTPYSKTKHWKLEKVLEKTAEEQPGELK